MMKRLTGASAVVLVLLAGLLVAVAAYPRFKKIEKRGPPPVAVFAVVPGDADGVGASIAAIFNDWSDFIATNHRGAYQNKFPAGSQWSHFYIFQKLDVQRLFPADDEILLDRGVDSFIPRYLQIPRSLRAHDAFLYEPSGDYYWASEYFYNGIPAKFRCAFIIHLEAAGDSTTRVEIFEYQPLAWVGEVVGFSAHAILPAALHDIRPVQPTTVDRQNVLAMIEAARGTGN